MINLHNIFSVLNKKHKYVALKLTEDFPKYTTGAELDIFCQNIDGVLLSILPQMNRHVDEGYEVKLEDKNYHFSICLVKNNNLHIRLNLYKSLPILKKISIKESLFDVMIERAVKKKFGRSKDRQLEIYVPEFYDDLLIKYIEFQEWYSLRGNKIQHAEYIQGSLTNQKKRKNFFDRVHYYTKLSDLEVEDAL